MFNGGLLLLWAANEAAKKGKHGGTYHTSREADGCAVVLFLVLLLAFGGLMLWAGTAWLVEKETITTGTVVNRREVRVDHEWKGRKTGKSHLEWRVVVKTQEGITFETKVEKAQWEKVVYGDIVTVKVVDNWTYSNLQFSVTDWHRK